MNDLISRQSAIDAAHKSIFDFFDICDDDEESPMTYKDELLLEVNKAITTRIKALPSAQQWIPCSERLPETEVLCCDDRGEMFIGYLYTDKWSNTGYSAENNNCYLIDCIAWMPLPQPWKGESNE